MLGNRIDTVCIIEIIGTCVFLVKSWNFKFQLQTKACDRSKKSEQRRSGRKKNVEKKLKLHEYVFVAKARARVHLIEIEMPFDTWTWNVIETLKVLLYANSIPINHRHLVMKMVLPRYSVQSVNELFFWWRESAHTFDSFHSETIVSRILPVLHRRLLPLPQLLWSLVGSLVLSVHCNSLLQTQNWNGQTTEKKRSSIQFNGVISFHSSALVLVLV